MFCVISAFENLSRFVLWPWIWSILVSVPQEECIRWNILQYQSSQLVDGVFQFCNFAAFLFVLLITERNVEFFTYNCGFVYFPFQFYQFLLHDFEALLSGTYIFRMAVSSWWPFYNFKDGNRSEVLPCLEANRSALRSFMMLAEATGSRVAIAPAFVLVPWGPFPTERSEGSELLPSGGSLQWGDPDLG